MHALAQSTMLERSTAKIMQLSTKGGNQKGWSNIVQIQTTGLPQSWNTGQRVTEMRTQHTVLRSEAYLPNHVRKPDP